MKMTLDQLKVDSYATQVSEHELTEIKGGTWASCVIEAFALLAKIVETIHTYGGCTGVDQHRPTSTYLKNKMGGL